CGKRPSAADYDPSEDMIEVRKLANHAEYAIAVELQKTIWGFDELEVLPVRFFVTAVKVGGQALGAFDGEEMVGFLLAIPGLNSAQAQVRCAQSEQKNRDHQGADVYLHSHMLGVLESHRNAGVGLQLKLAQKHDALARGFRLIEWTFDPFQTKNA